MIESVVLTQHLDINKMFPIYDNFNKIILEMVSHLDCQDDTKAYISTIFTKYKKCDFDYSKSSITLLYSEARSKQNFYNFQNLADWLFFSEVLFPQHLQHASNEYYQTVARLSYSSCYKLINKQWKLFEELSDDYIDLVTETKNIIKFT